MITLRANAAAAVYDAPTRTAHAEWQRAHGNNASGNASGNGGSGVGLTSAVDESVAVVSRGEALMWTQVCAFSPLLDGALLNPF